MMKESNFYKTENCSELERFANLLIFPVSDISPFSSKQALVLYTLPLLLMLVAYYYICKTLWKTDSHLPGSQNTAAPESISPGSQMVSTKASGSAQKTNKCNSLSVNKSSDSQIMRCNGASESSTINR